MSVKKYRIQKGHSYTVVSNKVINLLKGQCEVLGVYIYLSSLSPEWQFHKKELRNTLKIGVNKLDNILSTLSRLNLIKIIPQRDSKGRFIFFDMHVMDGESSPMNSMEVDTSSPMETIGMETIGMENSTYKENINTYKENKERARKKRAPLSENFYPDEKRLRLTEEKSKKVGLSPEDLINKFKSMAISRNIQSYNWQAEYEKYLINEKPQSKANSAPINTNQIRCTVKEYGPGHPLYDANQEWERKHGKSHGSEAKRDHIRGNDMRKVESYLLS